jgi:hypothetical protein
MRMRHLALIAVLAAAPATAQPSGARTPPALATFLTAHAHGKTPWHITVYELGDKGRGFLGRVVKSSGKLDPSMVDKLEVALAADASFDASGYQGGIRCIGAALGLHLERNGAALDLSFDCGRLQVGEHGAPVLVSQTLYALMGDVEAWALPCAPIVIDDLDIEACMPRGATFGGGAPTDSIYNAPRSPCPTIAIGTALREPKYMRRVGTFEISCAHYDVPACIKVCDTLRPLPNSTATEPFPPGQPVIEILREWPGYSGVSIWSDGTVLFTGRTCTKVRSQRVQLTAEKLAALLTDIEATGFLTMKQPPVGRFEDGENVNLRVTFNGHTNAIRLRNSAKSPETSAVRQLVAKAVGKNLCD